MAGNGSVIRYFLFCVFFSVGAGAIALSIVADEVGIYYNNRLEHERLIAQNERIKGLISDYEAQIRYIENEPNRLSVLERLTFGNGGGEDSVSYPKASLKELTAASKSIAKEIEGSGEGEIPMWVQRCSVAKNRRVLFFAGAGLVLITFIFFGTPGRRRPIEMNNAD